MYVKRFSVPCIFRDFREKGLRANFETVKTFQQTGLVNEPPLPKAYATLLLSGATHHALLAEGTW